MSEGTSGTSAFFRKCYSTLGIGTAIIFASYLVFFLLDDFAPRGASEYCLGISGKVLAHSTLAALRWITIILTAAIAIFSFAVHQNQLSFGAYEMDISDNFRKLSLPPATFSLLVAVGLLCIITGGASSPFSHYLIGVSSISILMARSKWVKIVTSALTWLIYIASSYFYVCAAGTIIDVSMRNWAFVGITMLLAGLAGWKNAPSPGGVTEPK